MVFGEMVRESWLRLVVDQALRGDFIEPVEIETFRIVPEIYCALVVALGVAREVLHFEMTAVERMGGGGIGIGGKGFFEDDAGFGEALPAPTAYGNNFVVLLHYMRCCVDPLGIDLAITIDELHELD